MGGGGDDRSDAEAEARVGNARCSKRGGSVNAGGVVGNYWTAIGLRIDLYHRERRSEFPGGIRLEKPPWWDGLAPPQPSGRGALAKRNVLQLAIRNGVQEAGLRVAASLRTA